MEYIADVQGLWYEGSGAWIRLLQPLPIIPPFSIDPLGANFLH